MIGTGILNQPYVFMESGIVGGVIGFIFSAILTWIGVIALQEAGLKVGIFDFSDLSYHIFGEKGIACLDYSIIIGGLGSQIAYVLVVGDVMSDLMVSWGCDSLGMCV
jgi:amino acid permease